MEAAQAHHRTVLSIGTGPLAVWANPPQMMVAFVIVCVAPCRCHAHGWSACPDRHHRGDQRRHRHQAPHQAPRALIAAVAGTRAYFGTVRLPLAARNEADHIDQGALAHAGSSLESSYDRPDSDGSWRIIARPGLQPAPLSRVAWVRVFRQDGVRAIGQGKGHAMSVTRKSERDTTVACPHCGKELAASHANRGNAGEALREKIAMTCPHCDREFSVALDPGDAPMAFVVALDPLADDDAEHDERTDRTT